MLNDLKALRYMTKEPMLKKALYGLKQAPGLGILALTTT